MLSLTILDFIIMTILTQNQTMTSLPLVSFLNQIESQSSRRLEMLVDLPWIVPENFKRKYAELSYEHLRATGDSICSYIPSISGRHWLPPITDETTLDDLPDLIVSTNCRVFMGKTFRDRFIGKGFFEEICTEYFNPAFTLMDINAIPEIRIFAAILPNIFMIDEVQLGNLPVPSKWEDLLDPIYKGKICFHFNVMGPDLNIIMYIFKRFGYDGLLRFRDNVGDTMNGITMAKYASVRHNNGLSIYLIHKFCTIASGPPDGFSIIYPEDGILSTPAFMLLKKGMKNRFDHIIDYLIGPEFGHELVKTADVPVCLEVENDLWTKKKLTWLGWDWFKNNDIPSLTEKLHKPFRIFFEKNGIPFVSREVK
jgi:hypothetical protein